MQGCRANVGWFYHEAYEVVQKYKEGKFILEKASRDETLGKEGECGILNFEKVD